jgi:hypothetical protein
MQSHYSPRDVERFRMDPIETTESVLGLGLPKVAWCDGWVRVYYLLSTNRGACLLRRDAEIFSHVSNDSSI